MKTILLISVAFIIASAGSVCQTTHNVNINGFAYDPATLNIQAGDIVKFNGTSNHPVLQVSESTYTANGITPLTGGFSFTTGSGSVTFNDAGTYYYVCTTHVAEFGMKGKVVVSIASGLDDGVSTREFTVYPVPFSGTELTVVSKASDKEAVDVFIYDMAGSLHLSATEKSVDGIYKVDCSSLPRGVYLMKVDTGETSAFTKIVKY